MTSYNISTVIYLAPKIVKITDRDKLKISLLLNK